MKLYIAPDGVKITQIEGFTDFAGTTIDIDKDTKIPRKADELRGGTHPKSSNSVIGQETLIHSKEGGYNALIHEIAHQVYKKGLTKKEKNKISDLHKAKKYMDNSFEDKIEEYFVQGVEAFYSIKKAIDMKMIKYWNNTKNKLISTDLKLYNFIVYLINNDK